MYVATIVWPDGRTDKILASGLFPSEIDRMRKGWEAKGCTITFAMEVWS